MTREEAKRYLEIVLDDESGTYSDDFVDAVKMGIKALEQEPCEDAISRSDMLDAIGHGTTYTSEELQRIIKALPPVNPQPKTGHWIDADGDNAICGCCNRLNHLYGTYCKHCGAKMESQERNDEE